MSNVVEIDTRRPPITCERCGTRFTHVPTTRNASQCPCCHWWVNEYGTPVSVHTCKTCGRDYTVCPPIPVGVPNWDECLDITCASYDPSRDADKFFQ